MLLSIIVPVYNVKDYVERSVLSVLNQDFKDFEIVLINDGSTDGSQYIVDNLAKKDDRIKAYHKENGGLSDARNFGVQKSIGKYLCFLDSDDYVSEKSYSVLMDKALKNDLDISMGNALNVFDDGRTYPKIKKRRKDDSLIYSGRDFIVGGIKNKTFSVATVLSVYKRSLITENNLFFRKGILHEDELWTPQVFLKADKVQYSNIDFYMHYQRPGSITNRINKTQNALDLIKIAYGLEEHIIEYDQRYYSKIMRDHINNMYLSAFNLGKLYRKEIEFKKDVQFLIRNANSFKSYIKTGLFILNGELYCKVNELSKVSKERICKILH